MVGYRIWELRRNMEAGNSQVILAHEPDGSLRAAHDRPSLDTAPCSQVSSPLPAGR